MLVLHSSLSLSLAPTSPHTVRRFVGLGPLSLGERERERERERKREREKERERERERGESLHTTNVKP